MHLTAVEIAGYRSLRTLHVPLSALNVLLGQNGVGKTNILNALGLLQAAASGTVCRRLMDEGGLSRVLWAGAGPAEETTQLIRIAAHFTHLRYDIIIGPPAHGAAALADEPTVHEERLSHTGLEADGSGERMVMHRQGPNVRLRTATGERHHLKEHLLPSESALSTIRDSTTYPELAYLRELLEGWRIYHCFDLTPDAPTRQHAAAALTPALAPDGHDLAAALVSMTQGPKLPDTLQGALQEAFPGAELQTSIADGRAHFQLSVPDMPRPLSARELSEGTLQYMCLLAALMAYRKPAFIAINEPEANLHENLLAPLARLITKAAETSQLCLVTQSSALARELTASTGVRPLLITRASGETHIEQPTLMAAPVPSAAAEEVIAAPSASSSMTATPGEPEFDAQIEEVRSLAAARAVLADIRTLIARLRENPDELAQIHPKIEARLERLRSTAVALPPEFASLTARLDEELSAIVPRPAEQDRLPPPLT